MGQQAYYSSQQQQQRPSRSGGGGEPNTAYAEAVLADTPAGYWRLGEPSGTTAADSSGNARDGTYTGGPTLGVAGALTGNTAASGWTTSKYVALPSTAIVAAGANWSMEAWLKFTGEAALELAYAEARLSSNTPFSAIGIATGHTYAYFRNDVSTNRALQSTALFNDDLWHHVVATRDPTNFKLYTDGAEVGTGSSIATPITLDLTYIGVKRSTGYANPFSSGAIDEVAVYASTLTPTRILAHYNARS